MRKHTRPTRRGGGPVLVLACLHMGLVWLSGGGCDGSGTPDSLGGRRHNAEATTEALDSIPAGDSAMRSPEGGESSVPCDASLDLAADFHCETETTGEAGPGDGGDSVADSVSDSDGESETAPADGGNDEAELPGGTPCNIPGPYPESLSGCATPPVDDKCMPVVDKSCNSADDCKVMTSTCYPIIKGLLEPHSCFVGTGPDPATGECMTWWCDGPSGVKLKSKACVDCQCVAEFVFPDGTPFP